jgi:four helix bundle protein
MSEWDGSKESEKVRQRESEQKDNTPPGFGSLQEAFNSAMEIFELTKRVPKEETYSLTDQIRWSSRSVASNIAEAWRKRRYEAAFVSKLNDSEGEAAETQTWLEFSVKCGYLERESGRRLFAEYDEIISMLVTIGNNPKPWVMPSGLRGSR